MPSLELGSPSAKRLSVVLVNPRNTLNMGAVARAMSNFGFADLRLVRPYEVAFDRATSAVGLSKNLLKRAQVFDNLADAVADASLVVGTASVSDRHPELDLRRLESGASAIRRKLASERVALLFGSERYGLSNQELAYCHFLMHIPTGNAQESMNLGQAVAICLYELIRSPTDARRQEAAQKQETLQAAPPPGLQPAQGKQVERVTEVLSQLLVESGYVKKRLEVSTHLKIRRLVRRLKLNATDAQNLVGMLKKIRWKMGL